MLATSSYSKLRELMAYLSLRRDVWANTRMPVVCDTAKIAVLDTCDLERTRTQYMCCLADHASDVVVGRKI